MGIISSYPDLDGWTIREPSCPRATWIDGEVLPHISSYPDLDGWAIREPSCPKATRNIKTINR